MKKAAQFFLFFILLLAPHLLLAQYPPQSQATNKSGQTQIFTGTLTKISDAKIWVTAKRGDINLAYSFSINQETVIVGHLGIGKILQVEYKSKGVRRDGRRIKKKTAVKITVLR
jgi:glucose uptake protein GlcU